MNYFIHFIIHYFLRNQTNISNKRLSAQPLANKILSTLSTCSPYYFTEVSGILYLQFYKTNFIKVVMHMDISIIGVPIFYGADKRGPEQGPAKLREKNIVEVIGKHGHRVFDFGESFCANR